MTDAQLVTICLTLLAILGSMYANRKSVEDMRDVLRAESGEVKAALRLEVAEIGTQLTADKAELRQEIAEMRTEMRTSHTEILAAITALKVETKTGFEQASAALKVHELEHHRK